MIEASAQRVLVREESNASPDYWRYHAERLALDFEWLTESVPRSSSILEIGGYPFFLTCALHDYGFSARTVDKLSAPAKLLASQLDLAITDCDIETERLPFSENSFDEVLFNEIFEHLRIDPIFTVEEIYRVLRPGGRLWLSTPNLRSLRGTVNFLFKSEAWSVVGEGVYAQYQHLRTQGWMGHVREYTSKEVALFLRSIGFELDSIIYRGTYKRLSARLLSKMAPALKPYFSIVAKKSKAPAANSQRLETPYLPA